MSKKTANGHVAWANGLETPDMIIPFLTAPATLTNQAAAGAFLTGAAIAELDLLGVKEVRMTAYISTVSASAANPRLQLLYSASLIAPVYGNYLSIGESVVECSMFTGQVFADSGWISLAPLARANNIAVAVGMIGGDAVADPVVNSVFAHFR